MVQPRRQDKAPNGSKITIEELARRQEIKPVPSVDHLIPREPLFSHDEHVAFLKWLRELRHSEVA